MSVANRKPTARRQRFADVSLVWEGQPIGDLTPPEYFRWKGVVDRVAAAILLLPGLPITALLVVVVRLTSKGPGIYRQSRVGKDGKIFMMYKIRTMIYNAEAETGVTWTRQNDRRITRVGRVLRKLHLDEFPQLFNVLRGEMSLIGPRPERPEIVHLLAKAIPGYLNRLAVLPGITGLAQINLPPDADLGSVRRKLVLDLEYIAHAGILLDLRMFLCTFIRLLGLSGERAMRIMGLHRQVNDIEGPPLPGNGDALGSPRFAPGVRSHLVAPQGDGNGNGNDSAHDKMQGNGNRQATTSPKPR